MTSNNDTHLYRIAGFHLRMVKRCTYSELTYASGEISRFLWKGINLHGHSLCHDILLYLYISATAIKECLKRIHIAVFLYDNTLERDAWNLQLTRHLRIHQILTPCNATVRTAIYSLDMERFLLWKRNFLSMEAGKVRHLTLQLGKLQLSIYLICKQNRLLLVHSCLVCTYLDKQVITRDTRTGRTYLCPTLLHTILLILCTTRYIDSHGIGEHRLSINVCTSTADHERAFLHSSKDIGVGDRA